MFYVYLVAAIINCFLLVSPWAIPMLNIASALLCAVGMYNKRK